MEEMRGWKHGRVQSESMRWNDENDFDKFFCCEMVQCIATVFQYHWDFPLVPGDNANQLNSARCVCVCLNFMASTMNTINLFRSTEQRNRLKKNFLNAKHMHNVFKAHKLYGFSIFFLFYFASNTKFLHQFVLCYPIALAAHSKYMFAKKPRKKSPFFVVWYKEKRKTSAETIKSMLLFCTHFMTLVPSERFYLCVHSPWHEHG